MNELHKQKLIWLVVLVVVAATIPPALFGESGDWWYRKVDAFQSLFAGLLALCAAVITVGQMRKSDLLQQRRHEELLSLSLKADRRKLEQALNPALRQIENRCEVVEQAIVDMQAWWSEPIMKWQHHALAQAVEEITAVLNYLPYAAATNLFDGETVYAGDRLKRLGPRLTQMLDGRRTLIGAGSWPLQPQGTQAASAAADGATYVGELKTLVAGMQKMATEYRISF